MALTHSSTSAGEANVFRSFNEGRMVRIALRIRALIRALTNAANRLVCDNRNKYKAKSNQ